MALSVATILLQVGAKMAWSEFSKCIQRQLVKHSRTPTVERPNVVCSHNPHHTGQRHNLESALLWQAVYQIRRMIDKPVEMLCSVTHSSKLLALIADTSMYGRFNSRSLVRILNFQFKALLIAIPSL